MSSTVKIADRDTIQVLLVITESCNLRCRYCYETNKSARVMEFDTAKRILDSEFSAVKNTNKKIVIQFFGGEPMLEFKLIKQIYDYIHKEQFVNYEYCFVVTNGTVLPYEERKWILQHKEDFICGLSLDGTKEVQDHNRSNSYDLIDFSFFQSTWPMQKVKMTISPDMLSKLAECVIHCHELGFGVLCNLADGVKWGNDSSEVLKEQLEKLIEYYSIHPEIEVCSMLKMPLLHVGIQERNFFPKWCGAGDHIHAYDTEGKRYPCQLFMGVTKTHVKVPLIQEKYKADELPPECQECILYGCCPTCIGTNMIREVSPFYHTEVECKNIKIQFLATSYLMYQKYKMGKLNLSDVETTILLRNICRVQEAFRDI